MMNKEQLETIKKGYQWWLEAENQADKNEFAECITTEDVPALIAEVERLSEDYEATDNLFHRTIEQLGYEYEENARLREALAFYADNITYVHEYFLDGEVIKATTPIAADSGNIARKALGDGDD